MTEQITLRDLAEFACVDDDTDDSYSYSVDSLSGVHQVSTSMSSMATTVDSETIQENAVADDNRLHRIPTLASSVTINVEGAFIVDEDDGKNNDAGTEHAHWERKDIRLPHHTDVVSHVAVDVGNPMEAQRATH